MKSRKLRTARPQIATDGIAAVGHEGSETMTPEAGYASGWDIPECEIVAGQAWSGGVQIFNSRCRLEEIASVVIEVAPEEGGLPLVSKLARCTPPSSPAEAKTSLSFRAAFAAEDMAHIEPGDYGTWALVTFSDGVRASELLPICRLRISRQELVA
ncbi:MAG: hypothetical protein K0S56_3054 [Microvirga sp.]|jgi:hypothetical protein|nr:hypothetical protein [Microvirga sp.]